MVGAMTYGRGNLDQPLVRCTNCGATLPLEIVICDQCGTKAGTAVFVPAYVPQENRLADGAGACRCAERPANGYNKVAMVMGLLAVLFGPLGVGPLVFGPLGLIFGGMGAAEGEPLGATGFIVSLLCTIAGVALGYFFLTAFIASRLS